MRGALSILENHRVCLQFAPVRQADDEGPVVLCLMMHLGVPWERVLENDHVGSGFVLEK